MGRIHPAAEQAYFDNYSRDRDVVRPLLSCFDVTHALRRRRGNDEVAAFILRPERFMAELLGLEREFLVVYSPFSDFQARTISLHDEIAAENQVRLDPLGSMIIGDADSTYDAVQEYLIRDPERPPIVAISKAQLLTLRDADAIRKVFVQQLFRRDLFAIESPIRSDTLFFGRLAIVSELVDRFRAGQNSGLFGLRRIGKTSVLYALGRRCQSGELGGFAYMDASNPAIYRGRWWQFLQETIRHFALPLSLERGDRSKVRALNITYSENDAAGHFKADVLRLLRYFPKQTLLLAIDEVETVTFDISPAAHWQDDYLPLWQALRSVHQETSGRLCFVLAGVNPHIVEAERVGKFDNPLFSTVRGYYLPPFDGATVRDMVRRLSRYMGIRCEDSFYGLLTEEYGGHPFLVRQACSQLARTLTERPAQLTSAAFQANRANIGRALDRNIRQILNVLAIWYPNEYELIRGLAKGDTKTFREFAELSAEFTEHMEGYGLVVNARTEPKITMVLVREYLYREQMGVELGEPQAEEGEVLLAEISRRRNRIEKALRAVLCDGLRFARGDKAAECALSCLVANRRAIVARFSYEQLWNELYFNELGQILDKHWDAFQNWFAEEKAKILQWLEQINRSRADAHARSLSKDDLAYLRVCFRRLEEKLRLV